MIGLMTIDPGQKGGIAYIGRDGKISCVAMPNTAQDIVKALDFFKEQGIVICYLEQVHAMPSQGVSSSFKFGVNYGLLQGMLMAMKIPWDFISPQKWQSRIPSLPKRIEYRERKNELKAFAQRRAPYLHITLDTADAVAMAVVLGEGTHGDREDMQDVKGALPVPFIGEESKDKGGLEDGFFY